MTRARNELHLIVPSRYYVTSQPKMGDKYVYGARSRFLTDAVMRTLESIVWPDAPQHSDATLADRSARVDVAGRLRAMWG
jgi:DNA helicase-2/ATP-dependent DNA helicase PcrA